MVIILITMATTGFYAYTVFHSLQLKTTERNLTKCFWKLLQLQRRVTRQGMVLLPWKHLLSIKVSTVHCVDACICTVCHSVFFVIWSYSVSILCSCWVESGFTCGMIDGTMLIQGTGASRVCVSQLPMRALLYLKHLITLWLSLLLITHTCTHTHIHSHSVQHVYNVLSFSFSHTHTRTHNYM